MTSNLGKAVDIGTVVVCPYAIFLDFIETVTATKGIADIVGTPDDDIRGRHRCCTAATIDIGNTRFAATVDNHMSALINCGQVVSLIATAIDRLNLVGLNHAIGTVSGNIIVTFVNLSGRIDANSYITQRRTIDIVTAKHITCHRHRSKTLT